MNKGRHQITLISKTAQKLEAELDWRGEALIRSRLAAFLMPGSAHELDNLSSLQCARAAPIQRTGPGTTGNVCERAIYVEQTLSAWCRCASQISQKKLKEQNQATHRVELANLSLLLTTINATGGRCGRRERLTPERERNPVRFKGNTLWRKRALVHTRNFFKILDGILRLTRRHVLRASIHAIKNVRLIRTYRLHFPRNSLDCQVRSIFTM